VPFQRILRELLEVTPGAVGAVFLDRGGEAVELWSDRVFDVGPEGLRAIGAYQGVYLGQLKRLCERIDAGPPQRFTIDFEQARVLSCDLKEGYYLVLIIDPNANEGIAWHHLSECRRKLIAEL
jgi:predicted regulator of Ras-like GTPase activity (Roadblock/LC7/MglB family)